ncbi:MAG: lldD [Aeromicrobium sp.]|jgi:L-lactate dehydrogenase (cytochrome)|nr:lldD [Aeromicrobium sp.]
MTRRIVPRWSSFSSLLRIRRPRLGVKWRVARADTIGDLREIARTRVPRSVFDFVDGAAEDEQSLRRSRRAFERVEFTPRVLRNVRSVSTETKILGQLASLPLVLAPTGFTRFMHHEGELAVASAADRAQVPYVLSTMGTVSPVDLCAHVPDGDNWFQLYLWQDREASAQLIRDVEAAGYTTLVLTVDTPVAGARLRDKRNGMSIPPALTIRTLFDMARRPRWWINLITTEPLTFASLSSTDGTVAEMVDRVFDPEATYADLRWLRNAWHGTLVVKGIQNAEDAALAVDAGADAIVVSNHGGRQLDRTATPLEQLPAVVAAVGDRAEVFVDGGVMSGADIVACVGLGATACLIGRAYLYALMAGGEQGVQRALEILHTDAERTMRLLGASSIEQIDPTMVRLRAEEGAPL